MKMLNPKDLEGNFLIEKSLETEYCNLIFVDSYLNEYAEYTSYPENWCWFSLYYFSTKEYKTMYIKKDVIEKLLKNKKHTMKESRIKIIVL